MEIISVLPVAHMVGVHIIFLSRNKANIALSSSLAHSIFGTNLDPWLYNREHPISSVGIPDIEKSRVEYSNVCLSSKSESIAATLCGSILHRIRGGVGI